MIRHFPALPDIFGCPAFSVLASSGAAMVVVNEVNRICTATVAIRAFASRDGPVQVETGGTVFGIAKSWLF